MTPEIRMKTETTENEAEPGFTGVQAISTDGRDAAVACGSSRNRRFVPRSESLRLACGT